MDFEYSAIAVGGTFDHIHKGHRALITRAFEKGNKVFIGITSDEFVKSSGKHIDHKFDQRKAKLESYIDSKYAGRNYEITKLDRSFGPGMFTSQIEAIVVSTETEPRVNEANQKRRKLGLPDLRIEVVPMVLGEDNIRISSTRIRSGETDEEGKIPRKET